MTVTPVLPYSITFICDTDFLSLRSYKTDCNAQSRKLALTDYRQDLYVVLITAFNFLRYPKKVLARVWGQWVCILPTETTLSARLLTRTTLSCSQRSIDHAACRLCNQQKLYRSIRSNSPFVQRFSTPSGPWARTPSKFNEIKGNVITHPLSHHPISRTENTPPTPKKKKGVRIPS